MNVSESFTFSELRRKVAVAQCSQHRIKLSVLRFVSAFCKPRSCARLSRRGILYKFAPNGVTALPRLFLLNSSPPGRTCEECASLGAVSWLHVTGKFPTMTPLS